MKLFELMRQIQDACLNDGNLEKEVQVVLDQRPIAVERFKIIGIEGQLNCLEIHVEE